MKGFIRLQKTANRLAATNSTERIEFARQIQKEQAIALELWYSKGGAIFRTWAENNYRTSEGRELQWLEPFMEELYLFLGHPWFEKKTVEKAAQVGFTEACIAYLAFCLSFLHIPIGFGAESQGKINMLVGNRIQPALDYIPQIQELTQQKQNLTKRRDTDNKKSLSVGGIDAYFFYANTSGKGGMERQATSSISSFTVYSLVMDELELWAKGVINIAEKRMQSSILPTQPTIAGSTPGAEGGVTATEVKLASYLFQWFVICSDCQKEQFLSPLGNLLKAVEIEEDGKIETRYIEPTGRPLNWFYHNETEKIATAYIGCTNCGEELKREDINQGHFRCVKTNITLKEAIAFTLKEQKVISKSAIRLPRLASSNFNASRIIEKLLNSDNPIDELQQGLGIPASVSLGRIALARLLNCVGTKVEIDPAFTLTILCIDQGKFSHPYLIQKWYFPDLPDKQEAWIKANKEIIEYGELSNLNEAITRKAEEWDVDITAMDSDPEYSKATDYALDRAPKSTEKNQVYLVDQVSLKGAKYNRKIVKTSTSEENEIIQYAIDRTYCCDRVKDRIYRGLQHFPEGEHYNPEDKKNNLLASYLSSERLSNGKWLEDPSSHDHWFMADSFGEIIALAQFYEDGIDTFFFTAIKI